MSHEWDADAVGTKSLHGNHENGDKTVEAHANIASLCGHNNKLIQSKRKVFLFTFPFASGKWNTHVPTTHIQSAFSFMYFIFSFSLVFNGLAYTWDAVRPMHGLLESNNRMCTSSRYDTLGKAMSNVPGAE